MENLKQRLIIVSNRAPISVVEVDGKLRKKRALGGLASALESVWARPGCLWVGWSGLGRSFSMAEFESLDLGDKLALINLESELYKRYYDGFAYGSLWPVFHGLPPTRLYTEVDLEATRVVTERFAKCVERVSGPDDPIWIHDFHLALLPELLRKRGMHNRIGVFMHIPFPEPEHFRLLPDHREIAQSLVRANVLGFQTQPDVDRFKQYAAEEELKIDGLQIAPFPIGIDYDHFATARELPEAQPYIADVQKRMEGKTVLFSVSRLDYTKGILQQLRAFNELLKRAPRRDLIYKMVVAPSREDLKEYRELKIRTALLAAEINRRHGDNEWQPVDYEYRGFGVPELAAWYQRADLMVVAPIADGMNLIAKEYVAGHGGNGILVLGERAGAAAQLRDAVLVNPNDTIGMANILAECLDMPREERRKRMAGLHEVVRREDVHSWAEQFLASLHG